MNRRLIAVLALSLVTLVGCGSDPVPDRAPASPAPTASPVVAPPAPTVEQAVAPPAAGVAPATVSIPSIGANSSLVPLGLNADGTLQVPNVHTPKQAGWFEPGPEPGQNGPAVIVGHIDGDHIEGVFYKLQSVKVGDAVNVSLKDGRQLHFSVYKTELAPKNKFPADRVFGFTPTPELRVITCGGSFDPAVHSYRDNTIVYAKLA